MATSTAPTKLEPSPVWSAMASPVRESTKPAIRIGVAAKTVSAIVAPSFSPGCCEGLVGSCDCFSGSIGCAPRLTGSQAASSWLRTIIVITVA